MNAKEMVRIIELKNKYYKKKYPNSYRRMVKFQELKKKIRLNTKNIIPLSKMEECLYDEEMKFHRETCKVKTGKYFRLNGDIHILSAISKTSLKELHGGLHELILDNPSEHVGFLTEKDIRENVLIFSDSNNSNKCSRIFSITPKEDKIKKIINYVKIVLFDFSDDYVGICFEVNLSNMMKIKINEMLNGDCEGECEYVKYYCNNKKRITKIYWNPEITRRKKVNDYITEIKCRALDFLEKYIPVTTYNDKAPISLDVYTTNYNLKEEDEYDYFLSSYNIHKSEAKYTKQFMTMDREELLGCKSVKSDFLFMCEESSSELNRSAKLIINQDDEKTKTFLRNYELINFYTIALYFFYLGDLKRMLTKVRNDLYYYYNKKEHKIYSGYDKAIREIQIYKMMFNNISLSNMSYSDELLQKSLKCQNDRFEKLKKKYDELELSFNNKMQVYNYRSTLKLTWASVILAVIAIIITLYFSCRQDQNNDIEKLQRNITYQTNEIQQQTNLINQILDKMQEKN